MVKILITGANSFIGTAFQEHMKQWPDRYIVDVIDMIDSSWREKSFSGYDVIYHVAGIAHSDTGKISEERKSLYYKVNTELTAEVAAKAKIEGVKQFIFMSSSIVYGDSAPIGKKKLITKETEVTPNNCYSDSKVQAERRILPLEDENFKICILRPPMIYGRGGKGNYPILVKIALKLPVFPKVKNERSMLYIGNLVEFVRLMIENQERGIFWPQNTEWSNTSEVVKMIAAAHGKRMILIPGFGWVLKILANFTGLVNKAFGSLTYDQSMSNYKEEYRRYNLKESIEVTEYGSK